MGEVVFFPPNSELDSLTSSDQQSGAASSRASIQMNPIIITNPSWFCNQVVGDLLAPEDEEFKGKCQRTKLVVMQIIKQKAGGCSTQFAEEMFRYMQNLDLCFIIDDHQAEDPSQTQVILSATNTNKIQRQAANQIQVFFPAIASNKLEWPQVFNKLSIGAVGSSINDIMPFYGRRLKCRDKQKHLIPSGVFSRLQVRLQSFCGVGNTRSYQMGFRWSLFIKGGITVVVRLGGEATCVNQQETSHPEWIDILLFCPSEYSGVNDEWHVGKPINTTVDTIIVGVKQLIFDICQATILSIPTVELEEWILRSYKDDAHEDVMRLAEIKAAISKEGLGTSVSWQSLVSTPVVELLLPQELKDQVDGQVRAMRQIQAEFVEPDVARTLHTSKEVTGGSSLTSDDKGKSKLEEVDAASLLYQQLSDGQLKILYDLICRRMDARFDRIGVTMDELLMLVKDIKKDVQKLMRELCRMEVNILNNCSSHLLTEVLVNGTLPLYPYLTSDSDGKLQKLKSFLVKKTAKLHFLCEDGPHKVEGQVGKEVVIKADGILVKAAPVLVPALRIMCCAARFAANAYLPGIAPAFFNPLLECLTSLDNTSIADLQSDIMTKALNALFDGIDDQIQHLYQKKEVPPLTEGQMREAICELLKDKQEDLDMHKDFGLSLVSVGSKGAAAAHRCTLWVCDDHVNAHTKLNKVALQRNPFL